jgi:hypothetical protein
MPRKSEVERLVNVIEAIAGSPQVHHFVVGYTSQSAKKRGQQYRAEGFAHLVILADKMISEDALDVESALHEAMKAGIDKRSALSRKWHSEKSEDVYRRSTGGHSKRPLEPIHSVYIAWCDRSES